MSLPGSPYPPRDGAEKRAFARKVAAYYERYVEEMELTDNFHSGIVVTNVKCLRTDETERCTSDRKCFTKTVETGSAGKTSLGETGKVPKSNMHESESNLSKIGGCKLDTSKMDITKVDMTKMDITKTDTSKMDITKSDVAEVDVPKVEAPKVDLPKVDVLKTYVEMDPKSCVLINALNYVLSKTNRKSDRCCKRPREIRHDCSPERKVREISTESILEIPNIYADLLAATGLFRPRRTNRSVSFCNEPDLPKEEFLSTSLKDKPYIPQIKPSTSLDFTMKKLDLNTQTKPRWLIEGYDARTKTPVTYTCDKLVLANGTSDLPNRLAVSAEGKNDPSWLLHDLKSLEIELDLHLHHDPTCQDPVLIVGAGLSAADAVIATRARNIPVLHVFRNKSADLSKQLPENMYPEYHKVSVIRKRDPTDCANFIFSNFLII